MIELRELREEDSKVFDLGDNKRRCIIQAGLHSRNWDTETLEDSDCSLTTSDEAGFSHKSKGSRLLSYIDGLTGKRRIYPCFRNKKKYIEVGKVFPFPFSRRKSLKNSLIWEGEDITFKLLIIPEGIKFEAILKSPSAPTSFSFPFSLVGLIWDKGKIKDGEEVVAIVSKGEAVDSSPEPIFKPLTFDYIGEKIEISLDTEGMIYPITVDPQVVIQPSVADGYTDQYEPDTNNGTSGVATTVESAPGRNKFTLLKFTLPDSIPPEATITAAELHLYGYAGWANRTYWACRLTQTAWVENTFTWNTYDGVNSWTTPGGDYVETDKATTVTPTYPNWVIFSGLANQVQYALDNVGGDVHILIRDSVLNEVSWPYTCFRPREHFDTSLRPKLIVDYTVSAPPPPPPVRRAILTTFSKYW